MNPARIRRALRQAASIGLLVALAVPGLASAQHPGRGGRGGQQQQQQQQQQSAQHPMAPPSQGAREANFRRQQAQPQRGRMSDEERQQLRRDISDHGRDIYTDRQGQQRR
jgi:hypothetical protein